MPTKVIQQRIRPPPAEHGEATKPIARVSYKFHPINPELLQLGRVIGRSDTTVHSLLIHSQQRDRITV
jgi:hypothetical protein